VVTELPEVAWGFLTYMVPSLTAIPFGAPKPVLAPVRVTVGVLLSLRPASAKRATS
jgi:hypothetical protein